MAKKYRQAAACKLTVAIETTNRSEFNRVQECLRRLAQDAQLYNPIQITFSLNAQAEVANG